MVHVTPAPGVTALEAAPPVSTQPVAEPPVKTPLAASPLAAQQGVAATTGTVASLPVPSTGATLALVRKTAKKRSRRRWIVAAGIAAVVLAWFVGRPIILGPVVAVAPIMRADLVQTLVASGHIETPYRVSIGSQITGVVSRIPVSEGQAVQQGDTLLLLDATEARALDVQAGGQLAQAAARLRQLREVALPTAMQSLAEAKATLLGTQQAFDRNLAVAGFDTPASRDAAQANLDVARARVRSAQLQVTTNAAGGSDYQVAQTQFSQASANLDAARSRSGYRVVTAPRAGVLLSRSVEVGDVVQPGKELMLLSPKGDVDIVVQIDERNLGLIATGQSALASADAYAKQSFPATVVFINPAVDMLRASVEVKLRVPVPPPYLRQDMTMSVDIEAKRHPQTLVVAASDVHEANTTHPWLMIAKGSRARRQEVTLGIVSGGKAEILSGAAAGDLVVTATAKSVTDGHRIRARESPAPTPTSP